MTRRQSCRYSGSVATLRTFLSIPRKPRKSMSPSTCDSISSTRIPLAPAWYTIDVVTQAARAGFQNIRMNWIHADISDEQLQELAQLRPTFSPVFDSVTKGVPEAYRRNG